MSKLKVDVTTEGGVTVASPRGRIDSNTAPDFEEAFMPLAKDGAIDIRLDFSDVAFLSSAGLRVIVMASKALKTRGQKLSILSVPANVLEVLTISGLTTFIDVQAA
ncbi:MAG TPA: STAS domain-containing protein [Rhodospirillaceae bacterium]|nr:STAS domain-containing protein [Rhodospirillaceae bacterium]